MYKVCVVLFLASAWKCDADDESSESSRASAVNGICPRAALVRGRYTTCCMCDVQTCLGVMKDLISCFFGVGVSVGIGVFVNNGRSAANTSMSATWRWLQLTKLNESHCILKSPICKRQSPSGRQLSRSTRWGGLAGGDKLRAR